MGGAADAGVAADTAFTSVIAPTGVAASAFASVTTGAPFAVAAEAPPVADGVGVLATAGSAFAVTAVCTGLEPEGGWATEDAAAVAGGAFAVDAGFAFEGGGWTTPSLSGDVLAGGIVSLVTVGNTGGGAAPDFADDCGGSVDFAFGSGRFEGVEMLMSATMSFRTSAKPYEVSTRNKSLSNPTIVPVILVPSLRRISSAYAATADRLKERAATARTDLPRMDSVWQTLESVSKQCALGGYEDATRQEIANLKFEIQDNWRPEIPHFKIHRESIEPQRSDRLQSPCP